MKTLNNLKNARVKQQYLTILLEMMKGCLANLSKIFDGQAFRDNTAINVHTEILIQMPMFGWSN